MPVYDDEIEMIANMVSDEPDLLICEEEEIGQSDVGAIENGIELTDKGLHWSEDGWWYFPRGVLYSKNEGGGLKGIYWYKKQRAEATKSDPEGKVEEKYIGQEDSDLPFTIPPSFKRHISSVKAEIESHHGQTVE